MSGGERRRLHVPGMMGLRGDVPCLIGQRDEHSTVSGALESGTVIRVA